MSRIDDLIAALPKAELHVHLEGTLEPELLFELAGRNGVELPYADIDALRAAYDFSELQDFLDVYYAGMQVLRTEQDFRDLAIAYLRRASADNVRHVEAFFDPQAHTERGVALDTVVAGFDEAMTEARSLGLGFLLIPCFLRHLPAESADRTLDALLAHGDRFVGVGLDSSELGHPPSKFASVFSKARAAGLRIVAHAGEEGPPDYVREALDVLDVDRIDHGNRALEDDALVERLVQAGMTLTVCPLSNLRLRVVDDLKHHPLKRMLDAGIRATVNSDDPAYFGGYVNDNFRAVTEGLDLTPAEVVRLARNAFSGSFLDDARKSHFDREITRVAAEIGAD